jgi:hypothetical protein
MGKLARYTGIALMDETHTKGGRQPARPGESLSHPFLHVSAHQQLLITPRRELPGAKPKFSGGSPQQDHPTNPFGKQRPQGGVV